MAKAYREWSFNFREGSIVIKPVSPELTHIIYSNMQFNHDTATIKDGAIAQYLSEMSQRMDTFRGDKA